jgi:hypothetical protein
VISETETAPAIRYRHQSGTFGDLERAINDIMHIEDRIDRIIDDALDALNNIL